MDVNEHELQSLYTWVGVLALRKGVIHNGPLTVDIHSTA
jgi:hypothetical protein